MQQDIQEESDIILEELNLTFPMLHSKEIPNKDSLNKDLLMVQLSTQKTAQSR